VNLVVDILLPAALAFIMFALGLTLVVEDFRHVFARPKAIAVGLFGQVVLLPVTALVVAQLFRLPAEMALGLMILAACPGGVSSGLITHLARGETALSISLTAVTSVAAVATVPFVVDRALAHFTGTGMAVELSVAGLVRGVFLLTTVPVAAGMALRHIRPALTARIAKGAERLATALFVLIVVATFVSQRQALLNHLADIGPAAALVNLIVMTGGFALAAAAGLALRDRVAIAAECGLQNAALGIYIAATVLQAPAMTIPSVVYAFLMNVSAIAFVFFMRRTRRAAVV
jgi:BASS family bile acid:Na+ symporter